MKKEKDLKKYKEINDGNKNVKNNPEEGITK